MPNLKYVKGANLERAAKKILEEADYFVVRSAGSKSPVDLIAVDINEIRLIQIKSGKQGYRIKHEDERKLAAINGPSNSRKEIWVKESGRKEFKRYHVM